MPENKESNPGLLCQRKRRSGKTFVRPSEVDVKIILSPKAASEMFQCFNLSKVIREGIIREKKRFFVKSLHKMVTPPPPPPFYEVPIYLFFRPFF